MKKISCWLLSGAWLFGAAGAVESARLSLEDRVALYATVSANDIVWGREDEDERRIETINPPYFTPDPSQVEVLVLVRYTNATWQRSRKLTRVWKESLPEGVVVRWVPMGKEMNWNNALADQWLIHQEVFFTAQMLGLEAEGHEVIARLIGRNDFALRSKRGVNLVARELGIDVGVFARTRTHQEVASRVRQAAAFNFVRILANTLNGADPERGSLHPVFIVNGKFPVSADVVGEPGRTYRIANRLIRKELESGRSHEGPTNDEAFAEWMAPREGEVFMRERLGRTLKFKGVYNHRRREIWHLGSDGEVRRVYRLMGEGDEAYFVTNDREATVQYVHVWRRARQYVSYEGKAGPQRYGAFLLIDYLTAPETLWVGLPINGREVALAFGSDGRVEARNDNGSFFGSWWLEAGNLNVSFGEHGVQSWPWRSAAKHVGFEVPQRSITPWNPEANKKRKNTGGEGR